MNLTDEQRANLVRLVETLESGQYRQGRQALKVSDEAGKTAFCCLGVACDISGVGAWDDTPHIEAYLATPTSMPEAAYLPNAIQDLYGMDEKGTIPGGPITLRSGQMTFSLAGLNDSGIPFAGPGLSIANVIRSRWLGEDVDITPQ